MKGKLFIVFAVVVWMSLPLLGRLAAQTDSRAACPSGRLQAKLTGWTLNGKRPRGTAKFDGKQLTVSVKSVGLDDGTTLDIFIDDEQIGMTAGLKDGAVTAVLTPSVEIGEGSRVRVLNDDRPIVSKDLKCDNSAPEPTPTPSASL